MGRMVDRTNGTATLRRRELVLAGAAALLGAPAAVRAAAPAAIYTPHELAQRWQLQVPERIAVPAHEERLYGFMAETQLIAFQQALTQPQYVLVVDANPHVQAAFVFWRLLPGHYRLVGAAPASTGGPLRPDYLETPQGVFGHATAEAGLQAACATRVEQTCRRGGSRVYDFGVQRTRLATGQGPLRPMRLQARAADERAAGRLGTPQSDGCVLLPASLVAFLDEYGLLDGDAAAAAERRVVPFRGRYLLVIDSERMERPDWCAPAA